MREDLLRFRKKQKYIVFDFETCNLNLASTNNKPWQLAFNIYDSDRLLESKDYFIKWDDLNLSEGARRVTGFNSKLYKQKAQDPNLVLDAFEKYLYDDSFLIIGHNLLGFDIYVHNIFRKLLGKKSDYSYLKRVLDTLCLAKAAHKGLHPQRENNMLAWQLKLNSFREKGMRLNLGACCKKYDVALDSAKLHDAKYDIQKNYEVFRKIIWEVEV